MTHETETTFRDRVLAHLRDFYGEDYVEENAYLPDPYRYADILVYGPVVTLAIEVENDFEAAIEGVGQSIIYASSSPVAVPVVVVPPGHIEFPEADYFRQFGVPIVEMDV